MAYLDSNNIGGYDEDENGIFESKRTTYEDDDRTPIEIWLDLVKKNLVKVRKNYFGSRLPKFIIKRKE